MSMVIRVDARPMVVTVPPTTVFRISADSPSNAATSQTVVGVVPPIWRERGGQCRPSVIINSGYIEVFTIENDQGHAAWTCSPTSESFAVGWPDWHRSTHFRKHLGSTMTSQDDRWDFLAPWCDRVRGLFTIREEVNDSSCPDSLSWPAVVRVNVPTRQADPVLRAICESLVLLAMVVQADPSAWMSVLVKRCGLQANQDQIKSNAPRLDRFELSINDGDPNGLEALFATLDAPLSTEFASAVRKVTACGGDDQAQRCRQWDVPITVQVMLIRGFGVAWQVLKDLRLKHGGWRFPIRVAEGDYGDDGSDRTSVNAPRGSHQLDCAFVMNLDIKYINARCDQLEVMPVLEEMMTSGEGLGIPKLHVDAGVEDQSQPFDAACYSQQGGQTLERVLCASGCTRSELTTMNELSVDCHVMPPAQLARMCSAIANARTTRQLSIGLSALDDIGYDWKDSLIPWQPWMWKHLAYALFRGRSSITHATFTYVHLTEDVAEDIASMINSSDPIRELYGSSASATMKLKEGTRLQMLPMNDADEILDESAHWQLATDVDNVVVLESASTDDQDVAKVVVPGYGLCEVARGELLATEDSSNTDESAQGVHSLDLNFEDQADSMDGLERMLQVIGPSLTYLSLTSYPETTDVVRLCPNLETLSIDNPVDAEVFLRAYQDNTPRLKELRCGFDDFFLVVDELANNESTMARTLKRMSCWLISTYVSESDLESIAEMLSVNPTLEYFQLDLPSGCSNPHVEAIKLFQNQVLRGTRAPLSLGCRLAFLSVFTTNREDEQALKRSKMLPTSSALPSFPMDRSVLSTIFEFAAENVRRQIFISTQ